MKVIIAGAGLGGLLLARALANCEDIEVVVCERDANADARNQVRFYFERKKVLKTANACQRESSLA